MRFEKVGDGLIQNNIGLILKAIHLVATSLNSGSPDFMYGCEGKVDLLHRLYDQVSEFSHCLCGAHNFVKVHSVCNGVGKVQYIIV